MKLFGKKEKPKKGTLRDWIDSIVFAVVAATIIRWLLLEAFTIPTSSMEKSLLVGDYLFVSKIHYGPRTPKTILTLPLAHQKIWGTDIPCYLDWIQLPTYRLPGFSSVKNNDVVVFNYPMDTLYPIDQKTNYIKRCVGIAGDTLQIINQQVYINKKPLPNAPKSQISYLIFAKADINTERVFGSRDITDVIPLNSRNFIINTTPEMVAELRKLDFVDSIVKVKNPEEFGSQKPFGYEKFRWGIDNFGPLYLPRKGDKIPINDSTLAIYGLTIRLFEGHDQVEIKNNKLYIGGNQVSEYTFRQNYYFMMGDNRHSSLDSRYWGFVPENHILGKAWMIWWSVKAGKSWGDLPSRLRLGRIFTFIH